MCLPMIAIVHGKPSDGQSDLNMRSYLIQALRYPIKLRTSGLALYKFTGNRTLFSGGDTPPRSTTS